MIQKWFLYKKFPRHEQRKILKAEARGKLKVIKETEKAVLFLATDNSVALKFWCPKSCLSQNKPRGKRRNRKRSNAVEMRT